jgi:hypothetical protein
VTPAPSRAASAGRLRGSIQDVFAVDEFRSLWAAQLLSVGGEQLARVALTVLINARTGSALPRSWLSSPMESAPRH